MIKTDKIPFSCGFSMVSFVILFLGLTVTNAAASEWVPPVGVPHPPFGITEKHTMYEEKMYETTDGPVPYQDAGAGPYTHYVDNTHPYATDYANPFGTDKKPRKTWPLDLPEGSVVEVHGGPYIVKNFSDKAAINGAGTPQRPVFFRGASADEAPIIAKDFFVFGEYVIVENLRFANRRIYLRQDLAKTNIHHISIRELKMEGDGNNLGMTSAVSIGLWGSTNQFSVSNVVVKGCEISNYGDRFATVENDACGVVVSGFDTFNTWIVDNKIGRMSGDSVRVGKNAGGSYIGNARKVFIGRNKFYDNKEDAIDIKQIADVVVTENDMAGTVIVHYDAENVWLMNNHVHNSPNGFISTGVVGLYIINNVFRDIDVKAIQFWGKGEIHIANNTITRVGHGIWNAGGGDEPKPIFNNIISELNGNSGTNYHIYYNNTALAKTSLLRNNLFWERNKPVRINWGGTVYTDVYTLANSGYEHESGSLQADPGFRAPEKNDFRLSSNSSAVDKGTLTAYNDLYLRLFGVDLGYDAVRKPRVKDGNLDGQPLIDVGALEFDPQEPPRPPTNLRLNAPSAP